MSYRNAASIVTTQSNSLRYIVLLVFVSTVYQNAPAQHGDETASAPTPRSAGYKIEFHSPRLDTSTEESHLPIRFAGPKQQEPGETRTLHGDFTSDIPEDGLQFGNSMRTADARSDASVEAAPPNLMPLTDQTWGLDSAPEPAAMLEQINSELDSSMSREMSQFSAIRDGLEQLRIHNQTLQADAEAERQRAMIARRQAKQSEQLAAEAKRSAEEANTVALETMSRVSQLEQELLQFSETPVIDLPPATANPTDPTQLAEPNVQPESPLPNADLVRIAQGLPSKSPSAETNPPDRAPRRPTSKPITDAAVDRQALADSLFGAEEYRLAMQVYGQLVDNPPQGADSLWFKFQIAGCLRNLKELDKAERYYRMVVGSKDELLGPTARWWLSNIEEQKLITAQVSRWDTFFQEQEGSQNEQNRQPS